LLLTFGVVLLFAGLGTASASASISPILNDFGQISLSVDGLGSNSSTGGPVFVQKPSGGTVREALMFAASTGFSNYTPVNGDVTIDGNPVNWDSSHNITNSIGSVNVVANVTSLVKPKVDAAAPGLVPFTVAEPTHSSAIDGEILAVVLNDPTSPTSNSVILLYGAQSTTGDDFPIGFGSAVDKSNPNLDMPMGLGISFGFQGTSQFSNVTVNGNPLTGSAGGQDDCDQKFQSAPNFGACANGSLLTVGGIGDSKANPADPTAPPDSSCAPRCDDELYDLLPFVKTGDTSATVHTVNPSNDDNIFFGSLFFKGIAAIVGEGIVLGPQTATNEVGRSHTLTARAQDANGNPVVGTTVTFKATSGPNAGTLGTAKTDAKGQATFSYTSQKVGTDTIVASFTDARGKTNTSNAVTKTWVDTKITAKGTSIKGTVNKPLSATVATFTDADTHSTASEYNATIKWGDGKSSTGTIGGTGGHFTVTGKHTYSKRGTFTVTVTITDTDNSANTATVTTVATIGESHAAHTTHATARLTGVPKACVSMPFTAHLKGTAIASVSWSLDGNRVSGKTVHRGKQYSARISVSPGGHHLTVKAKFRKSTHARAKTFHRTVTGCPAVAPKFTG
jgi:hypothetical protein